MRTAGGWEYWGGPVIQIWDIGSTLNSRYTYNQSHQKASLRILCSQASSRRRHQEEVTDTLPDRFYTVKYEHTTPDSKYLKFYSRSVTNVQRGGQPNPSSSKSLAEQQANGSRPTQTSENRCRGMKPVPACCRLRFNGVEIGFESLVSGATREINFLDSRSRTPFMTGHFPVFPTQPFGRRWNVRRACLIMEANRRLYRIRSKSSWPEGRKILQGKNSRLSQTSARLTRSSSRLPSRLHKVADECPQFPRLQPLVASKTRLVNLTWLRKGKWRPDSQTTHVWLCALCLHPAFGPLHKASSLSDSLQVLRAAGPAIIAGAQEIAAIWCIPLAHVFRETLGWESRIGAYIAYPLARRRRLQDGWQILQQEGRNSAVDLRPAAIGPSWKFKTTENVGEPSRHRITIIILSVFTHSFKFIMELKKHCSPKCLRGFLFDELPDGFKRHQSINRRGISIHRSLKLDPRQAMMVHVNPGASTYLEYDAHQADSTSKVEFGLL
eukprot:284819259_1